jgi:oligopeptide transport system substrate-binding protein
MLRDGLTRPVTRRTVMGAAWQTPVAAALLARGLRPDGAAAQEGGVIRWSLEGISDVVSLDPAKASDAQGFTVIGLMYGALVRLNDELLVEPDLAESWTVSDDGLTYTFTLREDAKFSDGTPITADDVVWTFNHALDPATGAWTGPYLLSMIQGAGEVISGESTELSGVTKIDERTVSLAIDEPSAFFLSVLTFGPSKISSQASLANPDGEGKVTSGAFSLASWNRGQGLDLVPNPDYWQPATGVSELKILFNQDSETAYQLFRTGGLDVMGSSQNPLPAARVPEARNDPAFKSTNAFNTRYVAFNNTMSPFDDVTVRQALGHAIDRETLANVVLGGTVNPTGRILPPGMPSSELVVEGLAFDPDQAKALLEEAGVSPADLGFTLTYGVEGDNEKVVTVLQSMWKENLGVDVTLEPLELSTFSSRLNDTFMDPATGLQAYFSVWGAIHPDPQSFLSEVLQTGVGNNNAHYSNAEFDRLTKEADVIVDDFAARAALYNEAEQIAVNEVGWLPLYNAQVNVLVRPCVEGVVVTGLYSAFVVPDFTRLSGCSA